MALHAQRLDQYPRNQLIEAPLVEGRADELDLLARFGEPTQATPPSQSEDPVLYWDLAFPCGLVLALEFHQFSGRLRVRLDADDLAHGLRHLGVSLADARTLAETDPDAAERARGGADPLPATYEIRRADADGVEARLAAGLTERDAHCRMDELVAEGGGFRYRITST